MNQMFLARSAVILMLALLGQGCAYTDGHNHVSSGTERVYNPETENYEWRIPDQPSTSPGASNTSRQAYR